MIFARATTVPRATTSRLTRVGLAASAPKNSRPGFGVFIDQMNRIPSKPDSVTLPSAPARIGADEFQTRPPKLCQLARSVAAPLAGSPAIEMRTGRSISADDGAARID